MHMRRLAHTLGDDRFLWREDELQAEAEDEEQAETDEKGAWQQASVVDADLQVAPESLWPEEDDAS